MGFISQGHQRAAVLTAMGQQAHLSEGRSQERPGPWAGDSQPSALPVWSRRGNRGEQGDPGSTAQRSGQGSTSMGPRTVEVQLELCWCWRCPAPTPRLLRASPLFSSGVSELVCGACELGLSPPAAPIPGPSQGGNRQGTLVGAPEALALDTQLPELADAPASKALVARTRQGLLSPAGHHGFRRIGQLRPYEHESHALREPGPALILALH